jgi:hypothetical protein
MPLLNDENRRAIHRLYFVERRRLDVIAAALQLGRSTVRHALVIDGGVPRTPAHGPYYMESDS